MSGEGIASAGLVRRAEVLARIEASSPVRCEEVSHYLGLLVIRTQTNTGIEYIDVIASDLMQKQGADYIASLEEELGCRLRDAAVEYLVFDRPHASILGSKSFQVWRVCKEMVV
ncbi:hypothetical protein ACWDUX_30035 [Streptomyces sp. NPDC003444]